MNIVKILLREALIILILFNLGRLLFLFEYGSLDSISNAVRVFVNSLRLDLATTAECLIVLYLAIAMRPILNGRITYFIAKYSSILLVFIISLIYAGEIVTYSEWGAKMNYKVFIHLGNPSEIFRTSSFGQMLMFGLVCAVIISAYVFMRRSRFLGFKQLRELITARVESSKKTALSIVQYVLIAPLLIIVMRGGTQEIPINLSLAYFTNNMVYNDAAVNSLWNLGYSLNENLANFDNRNPFKVLEDEEARAIVDEIHERLPLDSIRNGITPSIFDIERPNIVLLILESWSVNVISSMKGPPRLTPNFDRLVQDGLLFTEFHASGYTSDLAMPAIFSSFHALPIASISTQPSKAKKLPSLSRHLNDAGYITSFYFGGQLYYGNLKSYLLLQDFHKIVDENDLDDDLPRGRLGIHDEFMFEIHQEELLNMSQKQPFFSALFTLSTHSPYDMPMKSRRQYDDQYNEYLNSVHYTDSCLGVYMNDLKGQSFYDNTIFVIIGDHGHYSPNSGSKFSKEYNNIPLLIFGQPLKDSLRGIQIDHLSSQVDLAPTLLAQLNIPSNKFKWGKDILNPNAPRFAYYSGPNSISWVREYGYFAYENRFERYMHLELQDSTRTEELVEEGKAYAQMVFKAYLDY